jgi:hypothetical protein
MYWDRFDICTAYHHFSLLYSLELDKAAIHYQIVLMGRLESLRYKPGMSDSNLTTCNENVKMIYMQLVRKYCKR